MKNRSLAFIPESIYPTDFPLITALVRVLWLILDQFVAGFIKHNPCCLQRPQAADA